MFQARLNLIYGHSRKNIIRLFILCVLSTTAILYFTHGHHLRFGSRGLPNRQPEPLISPEEAIYVISLKHRNDRRADMEILRRTLAIPQWNYTVATDAGDEIVSRTMSNVRRLREMVVGEVKKTMNVQGELAETDTADPLAVSLKLPFRWPVHTKPGNLRRLRFAQFSSLLESMAHFDIYQETIPSSLPHNPLVYSKGDFTLTPYTPTLGRQTIVSPARVACWNSHLEIIRDLAMNSSSRGIAIILEDDVDMEVDIRQRLTPLWKLLPDTWDVVFLGHCWSDESKHSPLISTETSPCSIPECSPQQSQNSIHPSRAPQCTHAYVLSPAGARKLYEHLIYPPFAYSRAIDQALAWLVKSGRVNAFSVVPPVVVQRRPSESWLTWITSLGKPSRGSDIWSSHIHSHWRDGLVKGALGTRRRQ